MDVAAVLLPPSLFGRCARGRCCGTPTSFLIWQVRSWTLLRYSYLLLMVFAFASEASTIFIATHAIVLLQVPPPSSFLYV